MAAADSRDCADASGDSIFLSVKPRRILLFSGKRKSGKDYITDILQQRLNHLPCVTIKISGPIKIHWAKSLNLDFKELLGDGEYKEKYRGQMIAWGENMRNKDIGYFCRAAIDMYNACNIPIWIVSDIRRKTDIQWFVENFGSACKTVRIIADDEIRTKRGWIFTPGIDDAESECDLDNMNKWDLKVYNNDDDIDDILDTIISLIN
ncbi:phosphomevalonate kinase [Neodiprion lecontei]|uniref:Phosphomevalonate kinase n=1 Tax=Neodiprion lecontei TaxID=441921 RepID=A0A6J0BGN3_NEOLC|nr:phosphomevalonate kinase [Neodiprion lecontei]